jgi:perosamine synthetase
LTTSVDFPAWPQLTHADVEAAVAALRSPRLSGLASPVVPDFEADMVRYHAGADAIAVSSGTAALHLALRALDVGPGDEVIVPSHTFIGSASPIVYQGARPVFADVDPATYCLDAATASSHAQVDTI